MKISQAFAGEYLRAADLMGRDVPVTVKRVVLEEVGKERDERPVVYFQGKAKGLVLNKTNANTIAAAFGDDTDDWIGADVVLYEASVDFQGKMVASIRVKLPPRAAAARAGRAVPAAVTAQPADLDDGDIPF